MEAAMQDLAARPLEPVHKALPLDAHPVTLGEVGGRGWNALGGDLPLPVMVLKERALSHNLELMTRFCHEHGLELAPHGKTTMAPQLVHRQLASGAWGVTVATASQAALYHRFGVPRIIVANELLDPAGVRWIATALSDDLEIYCLVDSVDGVERLDSLLGEVEPLHRLPVFVELGVGGARAGCRTSEQVTAVVEALSAASYLQLAGVEAFEGVIGSTRDHDTTAEVRRFLEWLRGEAERLMHSPAVAPDVDFIVTAGGSIYPDLVAETLGDGWTPPRPTRVILRSGCYLTHDHGLYASGSPFGDTAPEDAPRLLPAIEVWGMVLSRPEPALAIIGFGKRDVPYDAGLPIPFAIGALGEPRSKTGPDVEVVSLNDQHAMVRIPSGLELHPGELLGCGISHPCTAFDKWSLIPVVDDDYRVIDAVRTFF